MTFFFHLHLEHSHRIGCGLWHTQIEPISGNAMTVDEDLIVMAPDATLQEIHTSNAGWDISNSRCTFEIST